MRWTKPYTANAPFAKWDGTTLHLVAPGMERRFTTPELTQYATTEALAGELGPELTVEILATIKHGPLDRTPDPTGRRSVPRVFGFGKRGESTPGAWLFGRSVRLSAVRGPDLPFEKILMEGLPPGHGLDRATEDALMGAVQTLSPLPCACGTGAETIDEHGAMESLSPIVQDPRAPITHASGAARCRVCGRCRIYTEIGDEAYSFRRSESLPFGPDVE